MNKTLILFLFSLLGCSTLINSHHVELESSPPAQVFLITPDQKQIDLGQTPLKISHKDIERHSDSTWTEFRLVKPGYAPENLLIEKKNAETKVKVNLTAVEWWNDPTMQTPSRVANQIGNSVKTIYRNLRQGKIQGAREQVENLLKQYPHAAILYDISGSLALLEGNKTSAIQLYEKSLSLDPSNKETEKILTQLKSGGRMNQ